MTPTRGVRDLARGTGALLLLLACVIGIPGLLLTVAPAWQIGIPTWSQLLDSLTKPDDGRLFLGALTIVGWLAWAAFTISVVVEAGAVIRGLPSPRLRYLGFAQRGAAALVAAAAVLLVAEPIPAPAATTPIAVPVVASVASAQAPSTIAGTCATDEPVASPPVVVTSHAGAHQRAPVKSNPHHAKTYRTVTVEHGDTLWGLAERYLGAGHRFREIAELNYGRPQRDGRALTDAHWIYPGWVLRIPAATNAKGSQRAPTKAAGTYTVRPGDTLWEIADKRLGDGSRYDEIMRLNKGRPQATGGRLVDADEIQPGWVLRLPARPGASKPAPRLDHPVPRREPSEPRPTPSRPVPPPTPSEAPAQVATPADVDVDAAADVPFAVNRLALGLTTLAAAGVVAELAIRRRRQQRIRRPGQRLPMPEAEVAEAEQELRTAARPMDVDRVRRSLHQMAAVCRAKGRDLPRVAAVTVSPSQLALILAEESEAVGPFRSDGPQRWVLGPEAEQGQDDGNEVPDPCPALVTVGVTDEAVILVNLEAAGTLAVVGDQQVARDVVRGLAIELATGALAGRSMLVLPAWMSDLAGVIDSGRACVASAEQAGRRAKAHAASVGAILKEAGAPDLNHARSRGVAPDVWAPLVLVSDRAIEADPCSGVISVQAAPSEAGWTLEVDHAGSGRLSPLDMDLDVQRLREVDSGRVVELLRTASAQPVPGPLASDTPESVDGAEHQPDALVALAALPELAGPPTLQDTAADEATEGPRILLLGRVDIDGLADGASGVRRARALELLAYLALHPGAGANELDEALWPGRRVPKETRNPFISRVRHWLGVDEEGRSYLPHVGEHGDYRLAPSVGCDWHDFMTLAKAGLKQGPDAVELLAQALALVRGRPFLGIDPANYAWAERDIQAMISAIVDVAHALGALRLLRGDGRGAQLAAAVGLLAEPCSELLHRDAIAGARLVGDLQAADALITRLRAALSDLDSDSDLEPETLVLISEVREWVSRQSTVAQGS